MSMFIILAIIALLLVFIMFKWNNIRTKLAYLFIFLGIGFVMLFVFFVFIKEKSDLSSLDSTISAFRTYLAWMWSSTKETAKITGSAISEEIFPKIKGWFKK